jgi:hypothetical protein
MAQDSKDKNCDFIKRTGLLDGIKNYFGIEIQIN